MKNPLPHLISFGFSVLMLAVTLVAYDHFAQSQENTYVHVLAPLELPETLNGSALQRAAFSQPDLLPVYGSSEINSQGTTPYHPTVLMANYPTGFQTFMVANVGITSLNIVQNLAAIGPDLKGKKVVISFTPTMFTIRKVRSDSYDGNFSALHANELAFSPYLSIKLKNRAAQRMLEYPETLDKDPLLNFTLNLLGKPTYLNRVLYYLVFPLGQLHTEVIRLQDHFQVLNYIAQHPEIDPNVTRQPVVIDWNDFISKAEAEQKKYSSNNPYGVDNNFWIDKYSQLTPQAPGSGDKNYVDHMRASLEWFDLQTLCETLVELGAKPMIMSQPINGQVMEKIMGISSNAHQYYYDTLENTAGSYHIFLIDFKDHDMNPYFTVDMMSHTSRLGWAYMDQAMDAYYHGRTP